MDTTQLMYAIYEDFTLRRRIEAVVRSNWWNDISGTVDPSRQVPIDSLAWAVATNATVQTNVASNGGVGDSVEDAINKGVPDGDLVYIVDQALPRLGL